MASQSRYVNRFLQNPAKRLRPRPMVYRVHPYTVETTPDGRFAVNGPTLPADANTFALELNAAGLASLLSKAFHAGQGVNHAA